MDTELFAFVCHLMKQAANGQLRPHAFKAAPHLTASLSYSNRKDVRSGHAQQQKPFHFNRFNINHPDSQETYTHVDRYAY
jgi:hypothetical protein